jgi:hypothetical protein
LIAEGLSSEDAAIGAGVSAPVGARWFRKAGGMPPSTIAPLSKPLSGRYLSFAEREELAIQHAQGAGVRQIARHMGRSGSTISRELRRNAATRSGELDYRATTAQWHADRAARRPKPAKMAVIRVRLRTAHRRAAGPAYPPRPHPGDERRELPADHQQKSPAAVRPGAKRKRQTISRGEARHQNINPSMRGVSRPALRSARLTPRIDQQGFQALFNQPDRYTFTPPYGTFFRRR